MKPTARLILPIALAISAALASCASSGELQPTALPAISLEEAVRARIAETDSAEVGVSLIDLATGRELHINGDVVMHAASTMKVPVLLEIFRQAEAGVLSLDSGIVVTNRFRSIADTSHYSLSAADDSDSTLYQRIGQRMPVRELARLMIVRSSNLATNILIDLVRPANVLSTLMSNGGSGMRVLRGVEDIPAYERGMNNTTTSSAYANVLAAIARCSRFTRGSCDAMLEILEGQEFTDMIPAGVPDGVRVANKTGSITRIQHDGAIIFPPGRAPYVLVVLVRGLDEGADARKLGADISRLVWQHVAASPTPFGSTDQHRVNGLSTRVFNHAAYWSAVEPYVSAPLSREQVGSSAEGRPLYLVRYGSGPTTVLLWSQMHGDESTATLALADLMRYMHDARDARTALWQEKLTILMLPMLNPDGAETFQRQNALGIDVNRDARALASPEARTLKSVIDRYKPDFGFNLHDQNVRTRIGNTGRTAAIALLAPAIDSARTDNAVRIRAKKVAAVIRDAVETVVPDHVAKYDDSFNPRAFGDLVQRWGTSTVLIESGGWRNDPEKQHLRRANVVGIGAALDAIASGSYANADIQRYESLLENGPAAYDILIQGGTVLLPQYGPYRADIAMNRVERNGSSWGTNVVEVGDLSAAHARDTVHAAGMFVHPSSTRPSIRNSRPRITIGEPASFTVTSDSAGLNPVYSIENGEIRRVTEAEARPAGPPHAAVGCHAIEIGPWVNPDRNVEFLKPPTAVELRWVRGTMRMDRGQMLMRPAAGAPQGIFRGMYWSAPGSQAIQLIFTTGFSGHRMELRQDGDVFRGTTTQFVDARVPGQVDPTAPVVLRRIPCN